MERACQRVVCERTRERTSRARGVDAGADDAEEILASAIDRQD